VKKLGTLRQTKQGVGVQDKGDVHIWLTGPQPHTVTLYTFLIKIHILAPKKKVVK
jgi:hypothetical protein